MKWEQNWRLELGQLWFTAVLPGPSPMHCRHSCFPIPSLAHLADGLTSPHPPSSTSSKLPDRSGNRSGPISLLARALAISLSLTSINAHAHSHHRTKLSPSPSSYSALAPPFPHTLTRFPPPCSIPSYAPEILTTIVAQPKKTCTHHHLPQSLTPWACFSSSIRPWLSGSSSLCASIRGLSR